MRVDLEHAFRFCPVCLEDRKLLGIHWQSNFYIDRSLPFGLRSSPFLFNRLADAVQWLLKTNYHIQDLMHYLNDYFTVDPSKLCGLHSQCSNHFSHGLSCGHTPGPQWTCRTHNPPGFSGYPHQHHLHGNIPTQRQALWVASQTQILVFPEEMSQKWSSIIDWQSELRLSDYSRRPYLLMPSNRSLYHRTTSLTTMSPWTAEPVATSIGGNGFFSLGTGMPSYQAPMGQEHQIWNFSLMLLEVLAMALSMLATGLLTPGLHNQSIQWKELYPIALASLLWVDQWSGKKLLFHCDNQAVVDIWASGSSWDALTMHLVRSIRFSAATNHFIVLSLTLSALIMLQPYRTSSRPGPNPCPPVSINPLAFGDTLASVSPEDGKVSQPLRPHYASLPPSWLTKAATRP